MNWFNLTHTTNTTVGTIIFSIIPISSIIYRSAVKNIVVVVVDSMIATEHCRLQFWYISIRTEESSSACTNTTLYSL